MGWGLRTLKVKPWLSVAGSFLVLIFPEMMLFHSSALSEPLFIFFAFAGLFLLGSYLENQFEFSQLFLAGVMISLACLTRYLGLSLIGAGVAALLNLKRASLKRRFLEGIFFLLISSWPLILWFLSGYRLTGEWAGRTFHVCSLAWETLKGMPAAFSVPFLPQRWDQKLQTLAGFFFLTSFSVYAFRILRRRNPSFCYLVVVWILLYLWICLFHAAFLVRISFSLDPRILLPIFIGLIAVAMKEASLWLETPFPSAVLKKLILSAGILLVVFHLVQTTNFVRRGFLQDWDFDHQTWDQAFSFQGVFERKA